MKFQEIEKQNRIYLSADRPLVIRVDGKNVTKNKKKYDLTAPDGFTKRLHEACKSVLSIYKSDALLYIKYRVAKKLLSLSASSLVKSEGDAELDHKVWSQWITDFNRLISNTIFFNYLVVKI